jgi:hypothetical protein
MYVEANKFSLRTDKTWTDTYKTDGFMFAGPTLASDWSDCR